MPVNTENEPLLANKSQCFSCSKVDAEHLGECTSDVVVDVSAQFAFQWLKDVADEDDVVRVMTQLLTARPELEASLLTAISGSQVVKRSLQRKSTFPTFEKQHSLVEDEMDEEMSEMPRLRFATSRYFVGEEEEKLDVEVTRSGPLHAESRVVLHTNDLSAKANVNYVEQKKMLVFKPGADSVTVSIDLIASDEWSPTLEFEVILDATTTSNAELDAYGRTARVKIDDKDAFPSNVVDVRKLAKSLSWEHFRQALENAPLLILMGEYLKLNFRNDIVRRGTIKMLMAAECHHLYGILRLFLSVLLVDKVFRGAGEDIDPGPPESVAEFMHSRPGMLVAVMCGMLLPFAVLHYLDYISLTWRVGGASRAQLLSALVRRLLHYDVTSRIDIKQGAEIMAMTKDVEDIVQNGYMGVLEIISHLQNLATVLAYQVISRLLLQEPISPWSIAPLAVHPILLALFAVCRRRTTIHVQQAENAERASLVSQMQSVTLNNTIIRNLGGVAKAIDQFEKGIAAFNGSLINTLQVMKNNMYFANWMGLVMLAAYTLVGGLEVVDGKMRMGIFLADITLFTQINVTWSMICSKSVEINSILPGLERVVILMNLPTDLPDRRKLLRHLISASKGMRSILEEKSPTTRLKLDDMPLFLKGPLIEFSVKSQQGEFFIRKVALQLRGELYIHQGEFIALVGLHGHGKSSILKIFGGELLPGEGNLPGFFVPPHLRVLHVGTEPGLFHGTLYDNLIFGVADGGVHSQDADLERVKHICELLTLPQEILALLDVPDKLCWDQVLSHTQQAKLGLARALVANPDVLLLHKPAMPYDDKTSQMVLEVIKSHVKNRGLGYTSKASSRSLRTCIFTSSKRYGLQLADRIYLIGPTGLIQEVQAEEVTEGMLA